MCRGLLLSCSSSSTFHTPLLSIPTYTPPPPRGAAACSWAPSLPHQPHGHTFGGPIALHTTSLRGFCHMAMLCTTHCVILQATAACVWPQRAHSASVKQNQPPPFLPWILLAQLRLVADARWAAATGGAALQEVRTRARYDTMCPRHSCGHAGTAACSCTASDVWLRHVPQSGAGRR